jgi:hypothetical protein
MSEESLFHEALAKPAEERSAFLDAACAGRSELRAAVVALLKAHAASGDWLDWPAAERGQTVDSEPEDASPAATGEYTPEWVEAEPVLRECLTIREKAQPDAWTTFNTQSLLGGALLGQKKYAEAEPRLLIGHEGMKQREKVIPPQLKDLRLREALERLVQLYEAMDKKDDAEKWRTQLEAAKAAQRKSEKQQ